MDRKEFGTLHASCVSAFRNYASEADSRCCQVWDCHSLPSIIIRACYYRKERTSLSPFPAAPKKTNITERSIQPSKPITAANPP